MNINIKNNNLRSYLKDADYLMVETLEELNVCIKHGLNKKTKIISFNPHVLYNKIYKVESPEKNLNSNYYTLMLHEVLYGTFQNLLLEEDGLDLQAL